jgi:hypothetical protein
VKEMMLSRLYILPEALGEKYLGLPTMVGKVVDGTFDYVTERIWGCAQGWSENLFSFAGREVLLKANAQAVPTYPTSCFRLPTPVCKKLETYISNFWWGSSIDNHKIHWQRWTKLTRSKGNGGIGFRDMPFFNQAMLGKQGWRLLMRPDYLCARVLKGKYYPHGDFLSVSKRKWSSETWRAILYGREALKKGLSKRVGLENFNILSKNWFGSTDQRRPIYSRDSVNIEQVHDLFNPGTKTWNEQVVWDTFVPRDATEILKLKLGVHMNDDVLAWGAERHGIFTVHSCYKLLKKENEQKEVVAGGEVSTSNQSIWWKKLWKLRVPPKIRIFWWRAMNNYLPTK